MLEKCKIQKFKFCGTCVNQIKINLNLKRKKMVANEKGSKEQKNEEKFRVSGSEILRKVEEIIREGNARRIIIKNEKDETIMEFPVTVGVVGVVLAPILAALGAIAALASNATIIVERRK